MPLLCAPSVTSQGEVVMSYLRARTFRPGSKTIRTGIVLFGLVSILSIVAACGHEDPKTAPATSQTPAVLTINGILTVPASIDSDQVVDGKCTATEGYADIATGTQVTVRDAAGKAVALGTLGAGKVKSLFDDPKSAVDGYADLCKFEFFVSKVPDGQSIYSVEVAHRGQVQFTRAALEDWITLTLG